MNFPISPEKFVRDFNKGKNIPVTKVRMEIAVRNAVGNSVTDKNLPAAMKSLRSIIKTKCLGSVAQLTKCPRCSSFMRDVILDKGILALYCPNDRVVLPEAQL